MTSYLLNQNWEYVESGLQNPLLVNMLQGWKKTDLPHDYSIEKGRSKASAAGLDEGFFEGAGLYYKKTFHLKEIAAGKRIWLEFEGVFGFCEVWVNKQFVAKHMNPYSSFQADVSDKVHPGNNDILIHVDSRMKPNSRWYVGTGLCRSVHLHICERVSVVPYGLHCFTKSLDEEKAVLRISVKLTAPADSVTYQLLDGETVVAHSQTDELMIENPRVWSVDDPYLYTLRAIVRSGEAVDVTETQIGVRMIQVDSKNGLRINGQPIKLKGGCIHHDLGILGAADHLSAERRRIRILKENGFNAVRLAHNPFGPAFFQACDELGMLCIEEAFDEWILGRTSFGLHITFESNWEKDLEDMINRDFNHPSIIMWSTGNEVEERDGSADGFDWAKRLANKVRSLDSSRPVTASACALFSEYGQRPADGTTGNQALNMAYDGFAEGRDIWGPGTENYFAPLDVASYNYKSVRYGYDKERFPDRVICGSESYPRDTYNTWMATLENENVIGDFVWTAWDYLGELGVGRWEITDAPRPGNPEWPWISAGCADIDLIGQKRPQSYYRDIVWNVNKGPHIFCLPPQLTGRNIARLSWGWLPVEHNYTYPGREGQLLEVHIYADCDEVELLQNGISVGKTASHEYGAVFTVPYVPGELTAVTYSGGVEIGRDSLRTAGETSNIAIHTDSIVTADGKELCFISIQAKDAQGNPVFTENGDLHIDVQGAALLALGNADPKPDRVKPFTESTCPLYQGKALLILRPTVGSRGCRVDATLGNIHEVLVIPFEACEGEDNPYVSEPLSCAALEVALGELIDNEKTLAILKTVLGSLLENPMIGAMKGMPLGKILAMGNVNLPQPVLHALDESLEG